MVDLKDVRVSMTVVLRHDTDREEGEGDLAIENFESVSEHIQPLECLVIMIDIHFS